jgi:hypothetical protein
MCLIIVTTIKEQEDRRADSALGFENGKKQG